MPIRRVDCDGTDARQPRFHGATPDATRSDSGNANEPRRNAKVYNTTAYGRQFNAPFNWTPANAPRFNITFAGADDDAANFYNELLVRTAPFQ